MVNVSRAWRQSLANDQRDYKEFVKITLRDNTVLNLTNENIWNGGLSLDDSVSSDSDFQIGSAIINKCHLTINNVYGDYDEYDFYGARVEVQIGLQIGENVEKIKKGKYIVDNATYNGQLISLDCYDYMYFFDVPYSSSNQIYPATIDDIVRNCCTDVGVTLNTYNFPHKNYSITTAPEKDKTTYREIISWCAQICGCFARCNNEGQLELKWYPQTTLETAMDGLDGGVFDNGTPSYTSGDAANGGSFNPWNTISTKDGGTFTWPQDIHVISSLYSHQISVDDVVITRVQAIVKAEDTQNSSQSEKAIAVGTEGYTVSISGNQFITESNANEILTWLGTQLIGFQFRKANISHASDPSIEAGDCAIVFDRKNNGYPIVVSSTRFSTSGSQNTVSAAQNPLRNSAARFSAETKNYVDLRQRIKNERTTRQQVEAQLASDIANSNGMYKTERVENGATKYYLHNKPNLNDSAIRILFSDVGITVTANGLDANPTWYGLRVNGDLISRILTATGVNADWIDTGALVVRDNSNNVLFKADMDNHSVLVKGYATYTDLAGNGTTTINGANITTGTVSASHLDLSGVATITGLANGTTTIDGGCIKTGTIDATHVNLSGVLTATDVGDNGRTVISGSRITSGSINADYIKAGTLQSQDSVNYPNFKINLTDGTISIKKGEINLGNGNFKVDNDGNVIIKSGYVKTDDLNTQYVQNASNSTAIHGSHIITGTLSANTITTGVLKSSNENVKFDLNNGKLVMNSGSININNKFIVYESGNVSILGSLTISDSSDFVTKSGVYNDNYTSIHGGNIRNTTISRYKISTGTLTADQIQGRTITASEIKSGTITAYEIAGKTITASEIATGTITATQIAANTITASEIKSTISLAGTFKSTGSSNNTITTVTDGTFLVQNTSYTKLGRLCASNVLSSVATVQLETWYSSDQLYICSGAGNPKITVTSSGASVIGSFSCSGTKNRVVKTGEYDTRLLYCYETPSPMFGDLGQGTIAEDGYCYIQIDPIFSKTIQTDGYLVFLQKCGDGDCYVYEKKPSYFIVKGTPKLTFDWEIKAKQFDCEQRRLDVSTSIPKEPINRIDYDKDGEDLIKTEIENTTFAEDAQQHIEELYNERISK